MSALSFEQLSAALPPSCVVRDSDWTRISSLGVGGGIDCLLEPRSLDELRVILGFCAEHGLRPLILGGGTNVVGSTDCGRLMVRVVRGEFLDFSFDYETGLVHAGAGLRLRTFAEKAAKTGYGGLAALSGIPGSVGGALVMNAGAHGVAIMDHLHSAEVMDAEGAVAVIPRDKLSPIYRNGGFSENVVIVGAFFDLPQRDPDEEMEAVKERLMYRRTHEPKARSAGCVFRNPLGGRVSAGRLIDECGLKGYRIGGAAVSDVHANYLVNDEGATEEEYAQLVCDVRNKVFEKTGFQLKTEIQWINEERVMEMNEKQLKVAVLKGGVSSEREVSLKSGACVASALREVGFEVLEIDLKACEMTPEMRAADVVFSLLHGGFGENGELQALLARENIPFVGCGAASCELVMDKVATKRLLDENGIPNAPWTLIDKDGEHTLPQGFTFPLVVKPPTEGSSVGVTIVKTPEQWGPALELAFRYSPTALVETFVKGAEVAVSVIDGKALPLVELRFKGEFYDYDAKYTYKNGATEYFCPPPDIPEAVQKLTQSYAEKFAQLTETQSLVRVDFIVTADGIPYLIEGNTAPGFTDTSLVPKAAKQTGVSFPELCAKLVMKAVAEADRI